MENFAHRLTFSRVFVDDFLKILKIYLIYLGPKIEGNEETQFHRYRYTKVHSLQSMQAHSGDTLNISI